MPTIELAHLTGAQKKAYILADNRIGEVNSSWELGMVALELESISNDVNIDLTGFDVSFLDWEDPGSFEAGDEDDQGRLDELSPVYVTCPDCGKEFNTREN